MALPSATIGRKTGTIIVCFLLLSFVLGLVLTLFKDSLNNLSSIQNDLLTIVENFVMLLISMVVIKKQVAFEPGDWKKVATWIAVINLIVVVVATILAISAPQFLFGLRGYEFMPEPYQNGYAAGLVKSAAVGLVETSIIIFVSSWLVLRKPTNQ